MFAISLIYNANANFVIHHPEPSSHSVQLRTSPNHHCQQREISQAQDLCNSDPSSFIFKNASITENYLISLRRVNFMNITVSNQYSGLTYISKKTPDAHNTYSHFSKIVLYLIIARVWIVFSI